MNEPSSQIYLAQQPILDRDQQLVAYELLFRNAAEGFARITDDFLASVQVILNTLSQFGLDQVLGDRRGFINVNAALLLDDTLELLPPHQIVLELLETIEPTPEIVARCRALRERGFTLALDDFVYDARYEPLLEVVDIIKFDLLLAGDEKTLAAAVRRLDVGRLALLAEKVETQQQFELSRELGFSLFQGYYFARPALISGRRIAPRYLLLLRLINLLLARAEFPDIEDHLKQDPNLAISLLRLANSAAVGSRVPVQSLRQALVVLGYRQTLRWVQLFLYAGESGHQPVTPLMTLAATRGRFLELLAAQSPLLRADADHAFVVGVLSLLDALLGAPMEEVLRSISLTEDIQAALRDRAGPLGTALTLAEAFERDDLPAILQGARVLGDPPEIVLPLRIEASYWAREVQKCCV